MSPQALQNVLCVKFKSTDEVWQMQVDAGAVGSSAHAAKEQLLRSALELRGRLTTASEQVSEAESQLKTLSGPSSEHAAGGLSSAGPLAQSQAGGMKLDEPPLTRRSSDAAAVLADLFGSSDDEGAAGVPSHAGSGQQPAAAALPGAQAAGVGGLNGSRQISSRTAGGQPLPAQADPSPPDRPGLIRKQGGTVAGPAARIADSSGTPAATQAWPSFDGNADSIEAWPEFRESSDDEAQLDLQSGGAARSMNRQEGAQQEQASSRKGEHKGTDDSWPMFEGSGSEDDAPLGSRWVFQCPISSLCLDGDSPVLRSGHSLWLSMAACRSCWCFPPAFT